MSYRWQTKREQPSHADDWLMTYADTITLLLCFFVIFLIVSIAKKDPPHQGQPVPVEEQHPLAQLPDVFPNNLPFHKIEPEDFSDSNQTPIVATDKPEVSAKAPLPDAPPVAEEPIKAEIPILTAAAPPPPPLPVDTKPQGDRITVLEMNSAAFFDSGSATLSAAGKTILQDVAAKLKSDEFKDYQVTVEGHTDDSPIHTAEFPSNWELSTARASAVVHFFLDQGIPAQNFAQRAMPIRFQKPRTTMPPKQRYSGQSGSKSPRCDQARKD